MRVLVTGGAGFVGANLVEYLSGRGHEVLALDDLSAGARPPWWGGRQVARCRTASVEDERAVRRAARAADAVIHLAAKPGVADSVAHPEVDFRVNVLGTFTVFDAARRAGAGHLVFASSGAVLAGAEPPLSEDMAPAPISPYGASKLYGEGIVAAAEAYDITGVSLRFANVYGPLSLHKKSVIAAFIRRGLARKPFVVYGSGRQTRDFLHVADVCRAVERSLGTRTGGVYHLGTGVETSVLELARKVAGACGVPYRVDRRPARPADALRNFVDHTAATRALGWRPEIGLDEGLRRTVDWVRQELGR